MTASFAAVMSACGGTSGDSLQPAESQPAQTSATMSQPEPTNTPPEAASSCYDVSGQWVATLTDKETVGAPGEVDPGEYLLTISDGYFRLEPNVDGARGNEQDASCTDGELVIVMGYNGAPPGYECEDAVGKYSWSYEGDFLKFKEVSDPECRWRAVILTTPSWTPRQ
jgi:hypothetical protein